MGGAGRRRMRARQCLAPTLCPNVGATHWVALGHSCRRARSCSEQTNREAGLGNCGRRGAPPDEGEAVPRPSVVGSPSVIHADALVRARNKQIARHAGEIVGGAGRRRMRARQCLAPTLCPNVGATHWVALGRSCRRARSCSEQTNREAGLGNCGRRGRRRMRARQCLAPTLCPNVGATHRVALGRSCRRARSCPEQTNREAGLGNCGRRGAPPDEGEAVPRPYIGVSRSPPSMIAGATHWVALGRSCRRARSCPEQTNREAGLGNCGRRGAPTDEGEACLAPCLIK